MIEKGNKLIRSRTLQMFHTTKVEITYATYLSPPVGAEEGYVCQYIASFKYALPAFKQIFMYIFSPKINDHNTELEFKAFLTPIQR